MKTRLLGLVLLAGLSAAGHAQSTGGGVKAAPRWLMMVATLCTDLNREADFNTWYNDIDIPDVLEVPGYQRARRGIIVDSAVPEPSPLPQIGRYVALYNIDSEAIDKTLIDMLMATRKMESRQRSTDLLKVTERVYYHELAPSITAAGARAAGAEEFLFLERVDCCTDAAAERRFNRWYEKTHLPQMLQRAGMQRATRYELYRVLMLEEQTASKYLTVFELTAPSLAAAQREADYARQQLLAGAPADDWTRKRSILYRKIRDIARQGAPNK
jgi:hypothetical protein